MKDKIEQEIKTLEEITQDLIKLFDLENNKDSKYTENAFYIHKTQMTRSEVIQKLSDYFDKVFLKEMDYHIEFSPITFIWTSFKFVKI